MVARRVQSKPTHIDHMGKPGQRVPVACVMRGKRPFDVLPVDSGGNMRVIEDVLRIVVIDKSVIEDWRERRGNRRAQKQINKQRAPVLSEVDNQAKACCRTDEWCATVVWP